MSKANGKGKAKKNTSETETDKEARKAATRRKQNANLRPWKPGEPGNPRGVRSQSANFTEVCLRYLSQPDQKLPEHTRQERLAIVLYERAVKGDMKAMQLLLDRVAPVTQHIQVSQMRVLSLHYYAAKPPVDWTKPEFLVDGDGRAKLLE